VLMQMTYPRQLLPVKRLQAILLAVLLLWTGGCSSNEWARAGDLPRAPIVIGHRGASGYRPEHTLEAYHLAIVMGADFVEPDLVPTRDGVLIARHENRIDDTTNIVELVARGELPDRKAIKIIDGDVLTGYFTEDYTLAEIKLLRARERIPHLRPQSAAFDDRFEVPTLVEILALVHRVEEETGLAIGIYPETKHPTFFAEEGQHEDGSTIRMDVSEMLIEALVAEKFTDPRRVYIQSFEFSNLIRLRREIMPNHGVQFPLVQLYGDTSVPSREPASFSRPYDMTFNVREGRDLSRIYRELVDVVTIDKATRYRDLTGDAVLRFLERESATGIAPWKDDILAQEFARNFVRRARSAGLDVHPYTLRAEEHFLTVGADGRKQGITREILDLLDLGVTGLFTDYPDYGRFARDLWLRQLQPESSKGPHVRASGSP
jgi:glycerophosphoryl diester phosphodiesterase